MQWFGALGVGLVSMALVGCGGGGGGGADNSAAIARGKAKFQTLCATCHGMLGTGIENLGKDVTRSEFVKSETDEELLNFIKVGRLPSDPLSDGKSAMPPKGGDPSLTDDQIHDIIAYVRSIQKDS